MHQVKNDDDVEAGGNINADVVFKNLDFTEKSIRSGFIRKVYSLLMVQLGITLGFVSILMYVDPVKGFVYQNLAPMAITALVVYLVTVIGLFCFSNVRRKAPFNYIFLFVFTVATSFLVGVVSSVYERDEVILAIGITTVITLGLTLFAWQTKYDFTLCHAGLFVLLLTLMIVSISCWFIQPNRIGQLIIAGFGAVVFSLLLIYDTQLIIGGDHAYSISPEEYVFATLTLYLDIINLFLRILRILRVA